MNGVRGALFGMLFGLFLTSCAMETEQAVSLAFKAKQCQDFELARHEVLIRGNSLTKDEKAKAIGLNRMAMLVCSSSMENLTKQMRGLAQ